MENIDTLIINRLGENQRKIDFINRNLNRRNKTNLSFKKISYTVFSVAACIAILFAIFPQVFKGNDISSISVTAPSFSEYRGSAFNNIESLISGGRYDDALLSVNQELNALEKELRGMSLIEVSEDEESYMITLYECEKEELMWSKIYLLVKLGKKEELSTLCNNYLNNNNFAKHKSEVKNILKKIQ